MGFFGGRKMLSLPSNGGWDLTGREAVVEFLRPKWIAIPLKYLKNESFELCVAIDDNVKIGSKIAVGKCGTVLYSSISGKVTAIQKRDHVSLRKVDHVFIENNFADEFIAE